MTAHSISPPLSQAIIQHYRQHEKEKGHTHINKIKMPLQADSHSQQFEFTIQEKLPVRYFRQSGSPNPPKASPSNPTSIKRLCELARQFLSTEIREEKFILEVKKAIEEANDLSILKTLILELSKNPSYTKVYRSIYSLVYEQILKEEKNRSKIETNSKSALQTEKRKSSPPLNNSLHSDMEHIATWVERNYSRTILQELVDQFRKKLEKLNCHDRINNIRHILVAMEEKEKCSSTPFKHRKIYSSLRHMFITQTLRPLMEQCIKNRDYRNAISAHHAIYYNQKTRLDALSTILKVAIRNKDFNDTIDLVSEFCPEKDSKQANLLYYQVFKAAIKSYPADEKILAVLDCLGDQGLFDAPHQKQINEIIQQHTYYIYRPRNQKLQYFLNERKLRSAGCLHQIS